MITQLEKYGIDERNKLINKNLILSKNLERSPIFSKLKIQSNINNNILELSQIRIDVNKNLNNLPNKETWVDDVGGINQEIERNNQIFQNRYRDSTLKEFKIEEYNVDGTPQFVTDKTMLNSGFDNSYNKYSIIDYYQQLDGRFSLNNKENSKNVLNTSNDLRDELLILNNYSNVENSVFSIQYDNIKKNIKNTKSILQNKNFITLYNIDNFYKSNYIEKDKTNFDYKEIINEKTGVNLLSDIISNNTKFKSTTTVYDILKRGLTTVTNNESELGKIGLKVLTNQFLQNITRNNLKNIISNNVIENIKDKNPFNSVRYEITISNSDNNKDKILNILKTNLIGTNTVYLEDKARIIKSIDDIRGGKERDLNSSFGRNLELIKQTGLGHQKLLKSMLSLNIINNIYFGKDRNGDYFEIKDVSNSAYSEKIPTINLPKNTFTKIGFSWYSSNFTYRDSYEINGIKGILRRNGEGILRRTEEGILRRTEVGILRRTEEDFLNGKNKNLIDYKSSALNPNDNSSEIQSRTIAKNDENKTNFISRGSNILKSEYAKNIILSNGYDEFCRVWTFHDQYNKPSKFIRHHGLNEYVKDENKRNTKKSVLESPGFVKICDYYEDSIEKSPKKYMLSLENLAWSDHINDLPIQEIGNGDLQTGKKGRIMWFPPYNLKFSESVKPSFKTHNFIGRGEPIYTYENTTESLSLSFMLIVDHPKWLQENRFNLQTHYEDYVERGDGEYSRFFAGCMPDSNIKENTKEVEIIPTIEDKIESIEKEVKLTAYFPNDVGDRFYEFISSNENNYECGEEYSNKNIYIDGVNSNGTINNDGIWGDILKSDLFSGSTEEEMFTQLKSPALFNDVLNDLYTINFKNEFLNKLNKNTNNIYNEIELGITNNNETNFKNKKEFKYTLPIKYNSKYNINNIDRYSWETLASFSFKDGTNRTEPFYRIKTFYTYSKNHKLNDELKNIVNKNGDKYKELKDIVDNANKSGFINITLTGFSSRDINKNKFKLNKNDNYNQIFNSFLSIRRIKTILIELLPNILKGDLSLNDNVKININIINKFTEDSTSTGIPNSKKSALDRKVEIVFNTTNSINENITKEDNNKNKESGDNKQNIVTKDEKKNESYFKKFTDKDDIIFDSIVKKIDYFHPAFQSQTPEDLNTRVVFLKQCARQAPISDDKIQTKNLVFGKQPVCILRIGDYVHTKVIINDISFQYESTWDLNPEGIGVQPMFVNVSLSMNVIGSQDITGPLNELKTALSYNLTANNSIYNKKNKKRNE
jgi:hypothetical protein